MKYFLSLSLVLFSLPALTAPAQTAVPPTISAVTPASGPQSGGTSVAITGKGLGLPPGFACILPCPAKVTFDGILAQLHDEKDTVLVVSTPQHAVGTVDVTVETGDGRRVTAKSAFTYASEIEATFEPILLPIYLDGEVPGANGSRWATQLWLRNNSADSISLAPWPCIAEICLPVFPQTRMLQPGESLKGLVPFFRPPTSNPSRLLWVTKGNAHQLSANLRLFNAGGEASDAGAEIPVVRDRELQVSTIQLQAVPLSEQHRINLRIYDPGSSDSRFRVRIYEQTSGTTTPAPLREVELIATVDETGEFRTRAAYATYDDFTGFSARPESIRIEVEPLTAGSRYWAFVSITNNSTQRATLVTP